MSLSTYAGLQAALGTWAINRTDLPTDDLITLAETRLNRDLRLRVMELEITVTPVVASRYIALPSDFLEPLGMWIDYGAGRQALRFIPADMETIDSSGPPEFWSVDATNIAFERPMDQVYTMVFRYVQRFTLSTTSPADGTQTNWLLTHWPDAYLAAGNIEAGLWLQEDDQASRWQARYGEAIETIGRMEDRSRSMASLNVDSALLRHGRRARFNIYRG